MFLINLSESIENLMCQENRLSDRGVRVDQCSDALGSVNIFEIENRLISLADGSVLVEKSIEVFLC